MKQAGDRRFPDWRSAAGELVLIVVGILIALARPSGRTRGRSGAWRWRCSRSWSTA